MKNKNMNETFTVISIVISFTLLGLIFVNNAFIPALMLWISLSLFSVCYYIYNDKSKRVRMYILFILGILLIVGSLLYIFMRLK